MNSTTTKKIKEIHWNDIDANTRTKFLIKNKKKTAWIVNWMQQTRGRNNFQHEIVSLIFFSYMCVGWMNVFGVHVKMKIIYPS